MKLLIAYPNPYSYSETFIHNHIKFLKPAVTLTDGWMPYVDQHKQSIFSFPWSINIFRAGVKKYLPNVYTSLYKAALKNFLIKNNVEVVLAEYGITACNMIDTCYQLNIPLVAHFHGFDAYEYKTISKFKDEYLRMSTMVKKIVVVSDDMKMELEKLGITSDKIINNPYGVELEKFQPTLPSKNRNILLSVGRLTPKKAPTLVIKSFGLLKNDIKDVELWMIGGGELEKECKDLIQELDLNDSITMMGVKSPEEISITMQKAKVFLQHSLRPISGDSEGTPNTVLEASSSGLPIVSTKHAGIKEAVVDSNTGYLVDEGDYIGMYEKVKQLMNDHEKIDLFGSNARKHMQKNYNIADRIYKLKEIIEG